MELSRAIEYFSELGHRKYSSRTMEVYVGHLRQFVEFVGDKPIEEVHLFDDVIRYTRHLERTGLKDNTINLAMTGLRQLWRPRSASNGTWTYDYRSWPTSFR